MRDIDSAYHIPIGRVTRWLVVTAAALVAFSVAGQIVRHYTGYDGVAVRLFYVDTELNVPTFFAVALLLTASVLLGIIAANRRRTGFDDWVKWAVLCGGFFVMALDEGAAVHERLIRPVRALLGEGPYGLLYYAWVVPAILLVVALGLYFMRFLSRLPAYTRAQFLIAATLFLGGAIGVELAGGAWAEERGTGNIGYGLIVNVEEGLELIGTIVFINALLIYMAAYVRSFDIRFGAAPALQADRPAVEVTPLHVHRSTKTLTG